MTARKRWTEPELPLPASDLALVAEEYAAPTEERPKPDPETVRSMFEGLGWSVTR